MKQLNIIIRSLLFWLCQTITMIFFSLLAVLSFPLAPLRRNQLVAGWAHTVVWLLKHICHIRHEVTGLENLPTTPSIILAKHQSAWETIVFQAIFPTQVYVLKKELLWLPIFGWGLACTSPIAINRAKGREALKQLLTLGGARLNQGFWVVIFPEGTRMAHGTRGKYHLGGAWLATQTGVPAVPVAHNAGQFWPKNGFIKTPGVIRVAIGKPIETAGLKADALNSQVEDWIEAQLAHPF